MSIPVLTIKKPKDVGLAIRRALVFGLPAVVLVGAITANIAMGLLTPKPEENEETIKATPVVVAEAQAESVRLTVTAQGEARPRTQINLTPQVSGKITYIAPDFIEGGAFEGAVQLELLSFGQFSPELVQFACDPTNFIAALGVRDFRHVVTGRHA